MKRQILLFVSLIVAQTLAMASFANFAVLLPEFQVLWSLTNTEAGWISGIYLAGYVLAVPVLVGLTDAIDAKRIYLVGVLIGVVGSLGFAFFAEGLWSAMLFRFISGVSLAGTYMPGLQILNDRIDEEQRQRVIPWYLGTVSLGTAGSFYMTGQLIEKFEWPVIFIAAGFAQIICFGLVFAVVSARRQMTRANSEERHPLDFRPVFRNKAAVAYILGYAGHSFELFAFRAWVIAFLVFAAASSGTTVERTELAGYVAVFSIVGMFASVIGAHFAYRTGRNRILKVVMGLSFLFGGLLGFLSYLPFFVVLLATGLYSGILMADSAALTAGTVAVSRERERGATLAMHSVFGFSGAFLGPVVVGLVLDLAGGQQSYIGWVVACFAIASGSLTALVMLNVVLSKIRRGAQLTR